MWAVLVFQLLLRLAMSLTGGFTLHFSLIARFHIGAWWLMLLALLLVSLFGLHAGWILQIGPLRRLPVWFRMSGISIGRSLGWFLRMLFLLLGMLSLARLLVTFDSYGVAVWRQVYFEPIP